MLLVRTCLSLCFFLSSSVVLPDLVGQTLLQAPVRWTWPSNKQTIAIFAFSRAAGTDAGAWRERIDHDAELGPAVRVVTIIMLEAVPNLLRGVVRSAIRSSIPARQSESTILSYHDENRWKSLLKVSNDRQAYVVLVAGEGQPKDVIANSFSEKGYEHLKREVLLPE